MVVKVSGVPFRVVQSNISDGVRLDPDRRIVELNEYMSAGQKMNCLHKMFYEIETSARGHDDMVPRDDAVSIGGAVGLALQVSIEEFPDQWREVLSNVVSPGGQLPGQDL